MASQELVPQDTDDGSHVHRDPKREKFCQELTAGADLYDAYVTAGFKRPRGNASRMLAEEGVQARVRYLFSKAGELAQICGARVLLEYEKIAFSNIANYWEIDKRSGQLTRLRLNEASRSQLAAVQEISYDSEGRPKLRLHDKVGALKVLLDHVQPGLPRRLEVTGADGAPLIPEASSEFEVARRIAFVFAMAEKALPPE